MRVVNEVEVRFGSFAPAKIGGLVRFGKSPVRLTNNVSALAKLKAAKTSVNTNVNTPFACNLVIHTMHSGLMGGNTIPEKIELGPVYGRNRSQTSANKRIFRFDPLKCSKSRHIC
jgi:hypothetical protein